MFIKLNSDTFLILMILILSHIPIINGQEIDSITTDTLGKKTFADLSNEFYKLYEINPKASMVYMKEYIRRGKVNDNPVIIAQGYHHIAMIYENSDSYLKYADTIVNLTKESNDFSYPSSGYLMKASHYFEKRSFKKALDNYILANKYARQNNNGDHIYSSNFSIGVLKNRVGEHQEALKIFKECFNYSKKKKGRNYRNDLFALNSVLYKLNLLDSASYYNEIGIKEAKKFKDEQIYNYFLLGSGVINYYKKNYFKSKDSIFKSLRYLEIKDEKPNLAVAYFYLGKLFYDQKKYKESIPYFVKLDSIFKLQLDILPETREGYELLISHYKKNKNIVKQLEYTQQLIKVDSVLNSNYKYLLKGIIKDYDNSIVVSQKDDTIYKLKNKIIEYTILFITIIFTVSIASFFYIHNKRKLYKQKFDELISVKQTTFRNEESNSVKPKNIINDLNKLNIPNNVVDDVLEGIKLFEEKNSYLDSTYNLSTLAKQLKTNSTYLSKIINVSKEKNFSTYINDLRIDYAINRLKNDKIFRSYSIKGISEEVGFKNSESFSKAFNKRTGIYPSYFIKRLSSV